MSNIQGSKPVWYFPVPLLRTTIYYQARGRFLIPDFCSFTVSSNFFASNSCEKVGHRRTAKIDRNISMDCAERKKYEKSTPGQIFDRAISMNVAEWKLYEKSTLGKHVYVKQTFLSDRGKRGLDFTSINVKSFVISHLGLVQYTNLKIPFKLAWKYQVMTLKPSRRELICQEL